ncbi:hypothetical protein [uncultured Aquabacterium sp.]|jgi:hypothetical protein|uniref:hypothetical protein n=1 Tax=uncultured Aquabacterium sp. TaxID=158753 RepID=UPI00261F8F8D|nr:hypothetical protein [uncultured Aquabacterium sp.]
MHHAAACLTRRRLLSLTALLPAALTVAGCASLLGPRTVVITREELLRKLGQRFPSTKRLLNLLDVQAGLPELTLQPQANRVLAAVPLQARDLLMGQSYTGKVALSFGLRYEPQDLSVRLSQVRVEEINVNGLPAAARQHLTRLGAWLAEERLQDQIIHQFKPEDLRTADRMGYEVGGLRVTDTGLAIDLQPRR